MKRKATLIVLLLATVLIHAQSVAQSTKGSFKQKDETLFYEIYGKGSPIIFLAGGPGGAPSSVLPLIERYKANHQCILLHQRGTGLSKNIEYTQNRFNLDTFVEDVVQLYQHLKIEKAAIVGHSWGGMLAMQVAVRFPQKVKSLLLLSTTYSLDYIMGMNKNVMSKLNQADLDSVKILYGQLQSGKGDKARLAERLTAINLKGMFYNQSLTEEIFKDDPINMQVNTLVMGDMSKRRWNISAELAKIKVPTLIIQGDSDPIGIESAQNLHRLIKGSQLKVVKHCGHFIWIEKPAELNILLSQFEAKL